MATWVIILLVLLGGILLSVGAAWVAVSLSTFPRRILPGAKYKVGSQELQVPRLPHARYKSGQEPSLTSPLPMLDDATLQSLYALLSDVVRSLDEAQLEFWLTGGTLISAVLWHSLMVFDDDLDLGVALKDREFLWGPEMAAIFKRHGLETFFLRGSSLDFATKEGAALRVRKRGTLVPTADIFCHGPRPDGTWAKVDSWSSGQFYYNSTEVWQPEWLFPLQRVPVGNVVCPVGHEAEKMLTQQYGPGWSTALRSTPPLTGSHRFVFLLTNFLGVWRTK